MCPDALLSSHAHALLQPGVAGCQPPIRFELPIDVRLLFGRTCSAHSGPFFHAGEDCFPTPRLMSGFRTTLKPCTCQGLGRPLNPGPPGFMTQGSRLTFQPPGWGTGKITVAEHMHGPCFWARARGATGTTAAINRPSRFLHLRRSLQDCCHPFPRSHLPAAASVADAHC